MEQSPGRQLTGPAERPVSLRINAERLVVLGWSRAILLQLAHPLVAAGVYDHSSFRANPVASARRLHQTVRAMLGLTFGSESARAKVLEGIRTIHRRVHGSLRETVGTLPAGTSYSAEDPALLLWVHATVIESSVLAYEGLVAPLSMADRDAYCEEAAGVAVALGANDADVPRDWMRLLSYLRTMYESGVIAVGHDAREVSGAVLNGPLPRVLAPLTWTNRRLTVGWLPADMRAQYGLAWSARHERQFDWLRRTLSRTRRVLPATVALWPDARNNGRR